MCPVCNANVLNPPTTPTTPAIRHAPAPPAPTARDEDSDDLDQHAEDPVTSDLPTPHETPSSVQTQEPPHPTTPVSQSRQFQPQQTDEVATVTTPASKPTPLTRVERRTTSEVKTEETSDAKPSNTRTIPSTMPPLNLEGSSSSSIQGTLS